MAPHRARARARPQGAAAPRRARPQRVLFPPWLPPPRLARPARLRRRLGRRVTGSRGVGACWWRGADSESRWPGGTACISVGASCNLGSATAAPAARGGDSAPACTHGRPWRRSPHLRAPPLQLPAPAQPDKRAQGEALPAEVAPRLDQGGSLCPRLLGFAPGTPRPRLPATPLLVRRARRCRRVGHSAAHPHVKERALGPKAPAVEEVAVPAGRRVRPCFPLPLPLLPPARETAAGAALCPRTQRPTTLPSPARPGRACQRGSGTAAAPASARRPSRPGSCVRALGPASGLAPLRVGTGGEGRGEGGAPLKQLTAAVGKAGQRHTLQPPRLGAGPRGILDEDVQLGAAGRGRGGWG